MAQTKSRYYVARSEGFFRRWAIYCGDGKLEQYRGTYRQCCRMQLRFLSAFHDGIWWGADMDYQKFETALERIHTHPTSQESA